MDDDMKRRVATEEGGKKSSGVNLTLAKAIPFFGLAYYLVSRPALDLPELGKTNEKKKEVREGDRR